MAERESTYTFTARSVDKPDYVVTFTLQGNKIRVTPTGFMEQLGNPDADGSRAQQIIRGAGSQVLPVSMNLIERASEPINVQDASAHVGDDSFRFIGWTRLAGLRLAPVILNFGSIDNPEAAKGFARELEARQEAAPSASRFIGPLDYWLGWVGLAALAVYMLRRPND